MRLASGIPRTVHDIRCRKGIAGSVDCGGSRVLNAERTEWKMYRAGVFAFPRGALPLDKESPLGRMIVREARKRGKAD